MSEEQIVVRDNLDDVDAGQWDALAGHYPFMQHAFLSALHDSGCASPRTGWTPLCLTLERDGRMAGAMVLYMKRHSRGEYVFDHAWASAYARHGLAYYPKLLGAVPFTPVTGPRLLADSHADRVLLARGAAALARQSDISSLHVLFPRGEDVSAFEEAGYMIREDVQFHWYNDGYADLDDFLGRLSRDKRKKIRQDSTRVQREGITYRTLRGKQIGTAEFDFFYRCYEETYRVRGQLPYLTRDAFDRMALALPDQMVLILADRHHEPIAAALNIVDRAAPGENTLYGRYWGAIDFVSGLHFDTCYTQSIKYCIAQGIRTFEGGAQGEHKMARGLMPVRTRSAHWIGDARFANAIRDFLDHERAAVSEYADELEAHSPFKADHSLL